VKRWHRLPVHGVVLRDPGRAAEADVVICAACAGHELDRCLYEAFEKPLVAALLRHFTRAPFQILGPALEATLLGVGSLALIWLILWWMHRRKVFLRL
jgi:hypothetical protein